MFKFSRIVLTSLIAVSIAGAAIAADNTSSKSVPPSATTKATTTEHRFRGSVTVLDTKAGTLKVKGRSDEKSFVVGEKAKSAFDKVKVGDRVRLSYSEEGSKLVILSLAENKSSSDSKASK
jgi:hypothetical protein